MGVSYSGDFFIDADVRSSGYRRYSSVLLAESDKHRDGLEDATVCAEKQDMPKNLEINCTGRARFIIFLQEHDDWHRQSVCEVRVWADVVQSSEQPEQDMLSFEAEEPMPLPPVTTRPALHHLFEVYPAAIDHPFMTEWSKDEAWGDADMVCHSGCQCNSLVTGSLSW